jgi:hypothetical protein
VHESKDRIDVALIDSAASQLFVFVVIDAINTVSQSFVTLEFYPQEHGELSILKSPEIFAILALTRNKAPPELSLDK